MANSPLLKIPLLSTSQSAKEDTINSMVSYLERSMNDAKTLAFAGANLILPEVDLQRYALFKTTGVGASSILTINAMKRLFMIDNIASGNALTISCTTDTLNIPAGAVVTVYCDGVNLISVTDSTVMGGGGGATTLLGLMDTPNSYAGGSKLVLRVKQDLTGIEFHAQTIADLADVNMTGVADGYTLVWDAATTKFKVTAPSAASSASVYWKDAVDCATTGPIVLADVAIGFNIDTVTLTATSSFLAKDQADKTENGIYYFDAGVLKRRPDADSAAELKKGVAVTVASGATNASSVWFLKDDIAGIGDIIEFVQNVPVVTLLSLDDVDDSTPPATDQVLTWDATVNGAKFKPPQGVYPTLSGNAGKVLTVNPTATGVLWQTAGASSYPPMTGNEGKVLTVNSSGTDAEWKAPFSLPVMTGKAGKPLVVNTTEDGVEWQGTTDHFLAMFFGSTLGASELLMRHITKVAFTIPASFTNSAASAVTASTGTAVLTVAKNGTAIGTITFTASGTGVFAGAGATFAVDDILTVTAPGTADATLENVSVTLKGTK